MFACSQTAAVSKHVTVCVLLIHSIFQMIFLQQCICLFSPHTRRQEYKNNLERSFFPMQRVIYIRLSAVQVPCLILEYPFPDPLFTTPLMMRKGTYHWEAKW